MNIEKVIPILLAIAVVSVVLVILWQVGVLGAVVVAAIFAACAYWSRR